MSTSDTISGSAVAERPSVEVGPDVLARRGATLRRKLRSAMLPTITFAVVLIALEVLPRWLDAPSFIFPPLTDVLDKFTSPVTLHILWENSKVTVFEAMLGLLIGASSGIFVGFLLAEFDAARRATYPFLIAFQSMPKVAVAPLFIIWFGFGMTPKVLVVVILCFFPLLVNTMSGIMEVDRSKIDLFRSLCASRTQVWRRLLLPSSLPSIFAGLEVAVVFSFLGAITGEFVGADKGLAVVLLQQKVNYDTAGVFAVLLILSVFGMGTNQIVRLLRKRMIRWQE